MCKFNLTAVSSRSKNGQTIAAYLKSRNAICNYLSIMKSINPLSLTFQKTFNSFYGLNVARGMSKPGFYRVFDDYYSHRKSVSYKNILTDLSDPTIGTGRVETSFGSKILHTIDDKKPIIDNEVMKKLRACSCTATYFVGISKNIKSINDAVKLHTALKDCYDNYLIPNAKSLGYFSSFDACFPCAAHISEVKKIDFYIWAI